MSEVEQNYVCNLTLFMRIRLLCGLYHRRIVPPRWRPLAKSYCVFIAVTMSYYLYYFILPKLQSVLISLSYSCGLFQYLVGNISSLLTGNDYIFIFFTQNELTDVTLDSPVIFNSLKKQMKRAFVIALALFATCVGLSVAMFFPVLGFTMTMRVNLPTQVLHLMILISYSTKLLVLALFNARLLVLKRRLERYGFRATRHKQPQPYCQVYDEILLGLDATDNPLKALLFFDLIFSCGRYIIVILICIFDWTLKTFPFVLTLVYLGANLVMILVCAFAHIPLLGSAAGHCEDMAVFTATQLIKTPTADERRRMREFLDALEHRGARYRVLRALPINARLVLSALAFCTSQVISLTQTLKAN